MVVEGVGEVFGGGGWGGGQAKEPLTWEGEAGMMHWPKTTLRGGWGVGREHQGWAFFLYGGWYGCMYGCMYVCVCVYVKRGVHCGLYTCVSAEACVIHNIHTVHSKYTGVTSTSCIP